MNTPIELQNAIRAYAEGNKESFTQIYELSYQYLHTCVIHIVKEEDVALDMLQETYIEISRNILQLQNTNVFLNWAATIANRKCFAYMKKNKDILCDAEAPEGYFENIADDERVIPEEVYQDREKQRLIRGIIDDLSDIQRLCVIGFFYNEQKQEDIARELDIPVNTVKSHINRAKSKIKEAVVELDVKKGTRLYSIAPFMLFLLLEEAKESAIPAMSSMLASVAGVTVAQASVTGVTTATTAAGAVQTASAVAGGTVKAAALTLKAKIAIALASLGGVALIGTGAYFAAPAIGEFFDSSEEYSYDDDDDKRDKHKKDEEDDGEVTEEDSETQKERKEFEPWDTISHRLGGENRCFYYKGQKVTMPTMVGEWEELLGVEFVEKNPVTVHEINGVLDKEGTSYLFMINESSYELKSDVEEELEQFRNTETYGFTFEYTGEEDWGYNDAWCSDFSLLEDCNMFLDDIETVNEKLVEKYNIESNDIGEDSGSFLRVVDYKNGYYFDWEWDKDLGQRKLKLGYIPSHYMAYYRYLNDQMATNLENTYSGWFGPTQIKYRSVDITNDGLEDLILYHPDMSYPYTIITYDEESGSLYEFHIEEDVVIRDDGIVCKANSHYIDGSPRPHCYELSFKYYSENVIFVYDKNGNKIQLVKLSGNDTSCYINDKKVTKEEHDACAEIYNGYYVVSIGLVNADLEDYYRECISESINYHYQMVYGEPRKPYEVYDDSWIVDTGNNAVEVEAWKENYVSSIQKVLSGDICLSDAYDIMRYSGELYFNLIDINGDSIPELFLSFTNSDGYLGSLFMFTPESNGEYLAVEGMNQEGNRFISREELCTGEDLGLYQYDGKCVQRCGGFYYNDYDDDGYHISDENGQRIVSAQEYQQALNKVNNKPQIKAIPIDIRSLATLLDVNLIQLDENGYRFGE